MRLRGAEALPNATQTHRFFSPRNRDMRVSYALCPSPPRPDRGCGYCVLRRIGLGLVGRSDDGGELGRSIGPASPVVCPSKGWWTLSTGPSSTTDSAPAVFATFDRPYSKLGAFKLFKGLRLLSARGILIWAGVNARGAATSSFPRSALPLKLHAFRIYSATTSPTSSAACATQASPPSATG